MIDMFKVGDKVIERLAPGESATIRITRIRGKVLNKDTGAFLAFITEHDTRYTECGMRYPANEPGYRSIRSMSGGKSTATARRRAKKLFPEVANR